jgi:two-component system sensor histidine kinase MprB
VENACKFDTSGSQIEVVVALGATESGRPVGAQVEVLDRGPGFDPQDIDHVFDRFYRSLNARSLPGSGLGLSIVAEVAAGNGGTVTAENRPGGGARMVLRIPLEPVEDDETQS